MDLGINGRVAVLTGGDSGMGYKTAEFLLREGVKPALTGIVAEADPSTALGL